MSEVGVASMPVVMVSQWNPGELCWDPGGRWVHRLDGAEQILDDTQVMQVYGDEAFRRRAEMIVSSNRSCEPQAAPLVGRRNADAFRATGWTIDALEPLRFRVRDGERSVEASAPMPGAPLTVRDGTSVTTVTDVGALEDHLRTAVLGRLPIEARPPALTAHTRAARRRWRIAQRGGLG